MHEQGGIETVLGLQKYAASSMGKICGQPCQGLELSA
jgi:hypothetical protein